MRILSYTQAIYEATHQEMVRDNSVVIMGLGVDDERGLSGTTKGLVDIFGNERVFDTPLAEEGMTGVAIGMAMSGLRPIHTHARMDFLLLAMNQVVNIAAKSFYMYGGKISIPLVIRVLVGDGWGPQHSQSLLSTFAHIPGLKIFAPSNPFDAKGCLISAIRDDNPVIFVENFNLYSTADEVPKESYTVDFGKCKIKHSGNQITIVGISWGTHLALQSYDELKKIGIDAEIIDVVSVSPLDKETIIKSVQKTGKILVVDCGWTFCGISSEILASIAESGISAVTRRLGFLQTPCPTSTVLEKLFYPSVQKIVDTVKEIV